jgi:hypothetical protein
MKKQTKPKLKLYVWEDVLADYTSGIAFALARSPEHARKLIIKKMGTDFRASEFEPKPLVVSRPAGFYVYGGG